MNQLRFVLLAGLAIAFVSAGIAAGAFDPLAGLPRGSYVMEDGAIAVPLHKPAPAWLTDEVVEGARIAAANGNGFDWSSLEEVPLAAQFAFIRPGTWMYGTALLEPVGCTMNFIYGARGNYAIGTAGHCIEPGQEALLVTAPTVLVAIGKAKTSHDNGVGDDYAIIPIYSQFQQYVDTNVAVIGGPQGGAYTGTATLTSPVPLKHFGHGLVVGTAGTPRAGMSWAMGSKAFYFNSPAAPGDSGSAVLVAGTAANPLGQGVGVLTHLLLMDALKHIPNNMAGTRVTAIPATIANGDVNPLP